jgi:hypothetical protein
MKSVDVIQPEQLIGHPWCGQYAIRSYRGNGCAGWLFGAERLSENPCAHLPPAFGGGCAAGNSGTKVTLEIARDGVAFDREEFQSLQALHPHAHLLHCLEVGQCQDRDLAGASYMATEAWRDTLAQVLERRSVLDDQETRNVAAAIGAALARYHAENRVHGDVRAERICLVDGQWKLAPTVRRNGNSNGAGAANPFAARDDIYYLGLVLLCCLSRKFSSMRAKAPQRPVGEADIEQALRELPKFWQHWLRRCLTVEPCQRCSAAELALMDVQIPPPVAEVFVDREADQYGVRYRVYWQRAGSGTVQVYRWLRGRCPARGEIWLCADLERIAESVPTLDTETRVQVQPEVACHIIVATIVGKAAVIGDSITLTWAADVERLRLTVEGKSVVASWDWPAGAHLAQVMVREGAFPAGPNDPQAHTERCFRPGYMADGGRLIIPINPHADTVYVTVYAIYRQDDGRWERASGHTTGARAAIAVAPNIRVRYCVERVSLFARLFLKMQPWQLSMRADRTATLPELTLVAGMGRAPSDVGGGVAVLQVPSQQYEGGTVVQKDFEAPEGVKIENARLLVRGKSNDGVRLIPERGRFNKLSR